MTKPILTFVVCLAAALTEMVGAEHPNIVFILADDLGYGDVRCFNPQGKIPTPHFDRLASQGMRFTDAHSPSSVCSPTRYSLMTGRYNWRSRLKRGVLGGLSPRLIEAGRLTVAELLRQNGYATAAIGKWHLGMDWVVLPGKSVSELSIERPDQVHNVDYTQPIRNGPNSVGFDYYFGISASLDMVPYTYIENDRVTAAPNVDKSFPMTLGVEGKRTRLGLAAPEFEAEDVLPTLTRRAVEYIAARAPTARQGKPFFLYLPLNSPHTPILPTKDWQGKSGISPYADFVMQTDHTVGEIMGALDRHSLSSNTLVIVTSDNGCSPEANFPQLASVGHDPSYIFRGAKADIFDGGHRVPFIARWPGRVAAGTTNDALIGLVDFMATCAEVIGVKLPANAGEDSVSFLPCLLGQSDGCGRETLVHHSINGSFAIRQGKWKLELCSDSGGWSAPRPGSPAAKKLPPVQLYDLAADIGETTNLEAERSEIVERLGALLQEERGRGGETEKRGNGESERESKGGAEISNRPNFLFIYTDDQRYDALSVVQREQGSSGRFPWFRTPHMDQLAAEGVRFRNAFVVNSLCAPSRAVNLTGRYNHLNGVASNFRAFPTNNKTHATLLREAGYTTAYIGKWHMDSQRDRPGFDYHASYTGHARYFDPVFIVQGQDVPKQGWIDDLSTDYAIDFMKRQQGKSKPWSMVVGFKAPHGPFEPPPRAKERFAGEQARTVPNLGTATPYMGAGAKRRDVASDSETVPVNLDYFRCISAVDDCLGRLLDALDEYGFSSNTVVIYTSDNGFYLGEHGLGDKRSAYDESLRVPFLVRYPALGTAARGRVVDEMVLNLDLAESLLDFANVPAPREMQGRSWRPLLAGTVKDWRPSWFYEYFAERQRNSRVPDITAVRTRDAKLIKYTGHDEWTELFDLKNDPYETKNLFSDPNHSALRARLEAEHARLAAELGYRVPDYVDRPDWWGRPGGPDWKPDSKPTLRLHYDFTTPAQDNIKDLSGNNNHGRVRGASLQESGDGRKAFSFSGESYVEVPKSASLNPAQSAWTVEVVLNSEKPDGVLVARGGRSHGYSIWLQDGRPAFTVTENNKASTVTCPEGISGWTTLAGTITAERQAELRVDGRVVGTVRLGDLIQNDPNDPMQIGADLGSPVVEPAPPKFSGLIQRVRLFSGEASLMPSPVNKPR